MAIYFDPTRVSGNRIEPRSATDEELVKHTKNECCRSLYALYQELADDTKFSDPNSSDIWQQAACMADQMIEED